MCGVVIGGRLRELSVSITRRYGFITVNKGGREVGGGGKGAKGATKREPHVKGPATAMYTAQE